MKNIVMLMFLAILVLPFVNADIIMPGYHEISVINTISNFNNYPEYIFIQGGDMCEFTIVQNGTTTPYCYKFSSLNVYAFPKARFDKAVLNILNIQDENHTFSDREKELIDYYGGIKVLENIPHYKTVADTSMMEEERNYYNISLKHIKNEPDNTQIIRNYLFYVYIFIPIIALIILSYILYRRRK